MFGGGDGYPGAYAGWPGVHHIGLGGLPVAVPVIFQPGDRVQVWSESAHCWIYGIVVEANGCLCTVQYTLPATGQTVKKTLNTALPETAAVLKPSPPVEHGLPSPFLLAGGDVPSPVYAVAKSPSPVHVKVEADSSAGGVYGIGGVGGEGAEPAKMHVKWHSVSTPSGDVVRVPRVVKIRHAKSLPVASKDRLPCERGSRCEERSDEHLDNRAHPFDDDYLEACARASVAPEERSLRGLFHWIDRDKSGKIAKEEFEAALPQLQHLLGDDFEMSAESWRELDSDGNGHINFNEFAQFAGPRLGLPLGVKHLLRRRTSSLEQSLPCAIMGCPCEHFREPPQKKKHFYEKAFEAALVKVMGQEGELDICACGHKRSVHRERVTSSGEVPYPDYWSLHTEPVFEKIQDMGNHALPLFQHLFDQTYRPVWTRDRKKHNPTSPNVPQRFIATKVFRIENSALWSGYCIKRAVLMRACERARSADPLAIPIFRDIKTALAWESFAAGSGSGGDRLERNINEWYLFHGTSAKNAHNIGKHDFDFKHAGSSTGTLYGGGAYFAESITKADEYAKMDDGEFTVLLCRVLGGNVRYTSDLSPNAEELVQSCIKGPYDSVLGDREACKKTFREFVIFDTEDVYPEYIIHYRRHGEIPH